MLQSLLDGNLGGLHFILRWFHVFFGLIWIGLLYYFNFVQGAFMAEADAAAKSTVTQKLVPRALWWFRYGALGTFVMGVLMLMMRSHADGAAGLGFANSYWITILTGSALGTLMFLNVWLIIWPNQKIVIQNAVQTAGGGVALANAPACAARAGVASRTNVLFSIPMLFFMLSGWHLQFSVTEQSNVLGYVIAAAVLMLGLELNAIKGKTGPMTTIKGVIHCGFALTLVFIVLISALI